MMLEQILGAYSDTGYGESSAVSGVAVLAVFGLGFLCYVLSSMFMMMIFRKAGVEGWQAWVPILNTWKFLEIGGQPGWWVLIGFIPIVNIATLIYIYIAAYNIGLKLGKSGAWVVLYFLLPVIWLGVMGLSNSRWDEYQGERSQAPEVLARMAGGSY